VPHTHVRRTLTVLADEQWVRVLDGATELARHPPLLGQPCADRDEAHVQRLVEAQARRKGPPRLRPPGAGRPGQPQLLQRAGRSAARTWARSRPSDASCSIAGELAALQAAITEALARDVPHPNAVRLALERARHAARRRATAGGAGAARARGQARRARCAPTTCAPTTVIPLPSTTDPKESHD
jgi:hypothetical protein